MSTTPKLISSKLFAQAVRDNSNLELDWLWLAGVVTREQERDYCFERAQQINPHNTAAQSRAAQSPILRVKLFQR
jgi:hypothetical protein